MVSYCHTHISAFWFISISIELFTASKCVFNAPPPKKKHTHTHTHAHMYTQNLPSHMMMNKGEMSQNSSSRPNPRCLTKIHIPVWLFSMDFWYHVDCVLYLWIIQTQTSIRLMTTRSSKKETEKQTKEQKAYGGILLNITKEKCVQWIKEKKYLDYPVMKNVLVVQCQCNYWLFKTGSPLTQ